MHSVAGGAKVISSGSGPRLGLDRLLERPEEGKRVMGSGWRFFAGTVLGIAGIMRFFDAIWAWRYHGAVPNDLEAAIFGHSLKTYGWVYFIVAIILIASSFGVIVGSQLSRWIGVVAGAILAISSIWWMPYYPIWSLTYIAIGALVIYALVAYGSRDAVEGSQV
jgi:hypothetical protein